jgi:sterol desaturase/sphingolipid hydroxylase (fatty acid hydroxylase superfamily)
MEALLTFGPVGLFIFLLVLDALRPARRLPKIRGWTLRGIVSFVAFGAVSLFAPLLWIDVLANHRLIDATGLGTIGGAIVGLLVVDLATFTWHYLLHEVPFLWRWFHQVHHSAERIDTAGALYFSPLDMLGFTFVSSFALVWAVGVTAEAAMIASAIMTALAIFQHANMKTPVWLGYVVQRPESHNLHHGRDIHALNYGSLAIWDLVFGTWRNPREWTGATGLFDGSTHALGRALLGRDIHAEHVAAGGSIAPSDDISFDSQPTLRRAA